MRILILCVATFGAGILAGFLVVPDEPIQRNDSRESARSDRGYRTRERTWETESGDSADAASSESESRSGSSANVRALTARANKALERLESGELAEILDEADGSISGTVVDASGMAVSGVVITAVPDARPFDLAVNARYARKRPHEDRNLRAVAQEAIQSELWRRMARRSATSDLNGKYEIRGLMDSQHTLTAFHEQYDVRPLSQRGRVQPDAVVDFTATAVVVTKVEVRMPDGTLADHAWLRWQGPQGNGGDAWMKETGTVRMPAGKCKVKAQAWLPEPMESKEVEHDNRASGAGGSGTALVLTMESRRVLTARLKLPEGYAVPRTVEYRLRRIEGNVEIEPEELLKDQSNRHAYSRSAGKAQWFDLEPGRYLVAAFLDKRRLIAHEIAEVNAEGVSEIELPVIEPEAGTYVKVQLTGPDGGPVPGNISFRVVTTTKGRAKTHRVNALQQGDMWLVYVDGLGDNVDPDATMRVGTRDFGGATEDFSLRGGRTISFRFDKPAKLSVKVERFSGSGVEGSLYVALRGKLGADAWKQVSPDGAAKLGSVQPGRYDLFLYVRKGGKNYPIYKRPFDLKPGDEEASITVPVLHTLKVRWVGKGNARNVVLRSKDENLGWMRRDARVRGKVATFELLAAGEYQVECNRKRKNVRVPGPPEVSVP